MVTTNIVKHRSLARFAWLSIAAALITISLKTTAYLLTGSVGLLSDAMESFINLAGALMALAMLTVAARPADEDHAFGHGKAEYFSSGVEGTLILIAAVSIGITSVQRLLNPRPLEQIGIGLGVSVLASLVNLFVSIVLARAGKKHRSITLEADAQHLMTDVWTSGGVIIGVGAVALTKWNFLDPIIAILVAFNIIFTGFGIIKQSVAGLMDASISKGDLETIRRILDKHTENGVEYHALRTRQSGSKKIVSMHVLVPGKWSVLRGHKLISQIENEIMLQLDECIVFTHLEALADPASFDDDGFGINP